MEPSRVRLSVATKSQTFRFSASSGLTGASIYSTDFLGLLATATAATTLTSILASIRIKKITIYSTPTAASVNVNAEILWAGNQQKEQARFNDASVGTALPTCVSSRPPRSSDVSKWIDGSVTSFVVCKLTVPSASIVDVVMDINYHNQIVYYTPLTYTGSSGLSAGYVYFGPLDRVSSGPGATKLNPLGNVVYYG